MSPRTEQVSIYLRYISGYPTKETFIGYSLRPSKTGTALVHYYFFSLSGPRDKQVVFAIRAKLGLNPQMDVRPYAYEWSTGGANHNNFGKCQTSSVNMLHCHAYNCQGCLPYIVLIQIVFLINMFFAIQPCLIFMTFQCN